MSYTEEQATVVKDWSSAVQRAQELSDEAAEIYDGETLETLRQAARLVHTAAELLLREKSPTPSSTY
jgi:hypothetical protein